jgi:hypothetical protein
MLAVVTTSTLFMTQQERVHTPFALHLAPAEPALAEALPPAPSASATVAALDAVTEEEVRIAAPMTHVPELGALPGRGRAAAPPATDVVQAQARLAQHVQELAPIKSSPQPAEADLAWSEGPDLRVLELRLQSIKESAGGLGWDEPPVPLGAPATSDETARIGLDAAAEPARGWMQVSLTRDDR